MANVEFSFVIKAITPTVIYCPLETEEDDYAYRPNDEGRVELKVGEHLEIDHFIKDLDCDNLGPNALSTAALNESALNVGRELAESLYNPKEGNVSSCYIKKGRVEIIAPNSVNKYEGILWHFRVHDLLTITGHPFGLWWEDKELVGNWPALLEDGAFITHLNAWIYATYNQTQQVPKSYLINWTQKLPKQWIGRGWTWW